MASMRQPSSRDRPISSSLRTFLTTTAILTLASLTNAKCVADLGPSIPEWECEVCGPAVFAFSSPEHCYPFNATFDDISVGDLSVHNNNVSSNRYAYTNWTNFDVVAGPAATSSSKTLVDLLDEELEDIITQSIQPQLTPYSPPNYIHLPASKTGLLVWGVNESIPNSPYQAYAYQVGQVYGGFIYSWHIGCTDSVTGIPTSCEVEMKGFCEALGTEPGMYMETTRYYNATEGGLNDTMKYDKPEFGVDCFNYTIEAVATGGGRTVDLWVDEVWMGLSYWNGFYT